MWPIGLAGNAAPPPEDSGSGPPQKKNTASEMTTFERVCFSTVHLKTLPAPRSLCGVERPSGGGLKAKRSLVGEIARHRPPGHQLLPEVAEVDRQEPGLVRVGDQRWAQRGPRPLIPGVQSPPPRGKLSSTRAETDRQKTVSRKELGKNSPFTSGCCTPP